MEQKSVDRKRKRPGLSEHQYTRLEASYGENPFPDAHTKQALREALGLEASQINRWFEKRRRKARKAGELPPVGKSLALAHCKSTGEATAADIQEPSSSPHQTVASEAGNDGAESKDKAVHRQVGIEDKHPNELPSLEGRMATDQSAPQSGVVGDLNLDASDVPARNTGVQDRLNDEQCALLARLREEAEDLRRIGLASPLVLLPPQGDVPVAPYTDARLSEMVMGQTMPLGELLDALMPLFTSNGDVPAPSRDVLRNSVLNLATRKCHDAEEKKRVRSIQEQLDAIGPLWQWELRDGAKLLPKARRSAAVSIKKRAQTVATRLSMVMNAVTVLEKFRGGACDRSMLEKAMLTLEKAKSLQEIVTAAEAEQAAESAKLEEMEKQRELKEAEKARIAAEKELLRQQKEQLRRQKEEEKERLRRQKEEEKEKLRRQKEEEKEQQRRLKQEEKEKEKERKAAEIEAAKVIKKTGFDPDSLSKTASKFRSFFKAPESAEKQKKSSADRALSGRSPVTAMKDIEDYTEAMDKASDASPTPFEIRFPKPPMDHVISLPTLSALDDSVDAALAATVSVDEVTSSWQSFLQRAILSRKTHSNNDPDTLGLPPVWARFPDAYEAARKRLEYVKESGIDHVPTWRRKLLHFSDSVRPAYYGSWNRSSASVTPRNPFGQDPSLDYETMSDMEWEEEPEDGDDLGNSENEEDAMEEDGEDGEQGSFMVADGYLSASEGVQIDGEDDNDSDVDNEAISRRVRQQGFYDSATAEREETTQGLRRRALTLLREQLRRSHTTGKPLLIVRSDRDDDGEARDRLEQAGASGKDKDVTNHAGQSGVLHGDAMLLEALAMEMLYPELCVEPPREEVMTADAAIAITKTDAKKTDEAKDPVLCAAKAPESGGEGDVPTVRRSTAYNDLLSDLARFVVENAKSTKPILVEGFVSLHQDRKIPKKWVNEKITEIAERTGGAYRLKPGALDPMGVVETNDASHANAGKTTKKESIKEGVIIVDKEEAGRTDVDMRKNEKTTTPMEGAKFGPLDRLFMKESPRIIQNQSGAQEEAEGSIKKRCEDVGSPSTRVDALPPLDVPDDAIESTDNGFWTSLLRHIDADQDARKGLSYARVFQEHVLRRLVVGMPAYIPAALLSAAKRYLGLDLHSRNHHDRDASYPHHLHNGHLLVHLVMKCLRATTDVLAEEANASMVLPEITSSQMAWGAPRCAQTVASLVEFAKEPDVIPVLERCIRGGTALGSREALAIAGILVKHPMARDRLLEVTRTLIVEPQETDPDLCDNLTDKFVDVLESTKKNSSCRDMQQAAAAVLSDIAAMRTST